MGARQDLYFDRHLAWLKYFTYQLVAYRCWVRTTSNTFCLRPKLTLVLCRDTPTIKNEVALLSQLILFSYYYDHEMNYWTLGFIFIYRALFHTIFLHCEKFAIFSNLNFTQLYINFKKVCYSLSELHVRSVY
jgi:hypothetical protein